LTKTTGKGKLKQIYYPCNKAVSYRDLEEIMAERGVEVDHATLNRWVVKFSPLIAKQAHNGLPIKLM